MEQGDNGRINKVRTSKTVFDVVEYIKNNEGVTITDVADDLNIAKSTSYRHLSTLNAMNYLHKKGNEYFLGIKFLKLGQYIRNRNREYMLSRQKVDELANKTGERAQFIIQEKGESVYLHRTLGSQAVQTDPGLGKLGGIHATAGGKAILAFLPSVERKNIINNLDMKKLTENTITNKSKLLNELEKIEERGYSFNDEENLNGLRAVGVSVESKDEEIIGALSISGPTHRFHGEHYHEELPQLLLGTANELELNIKHS